MKHLSDYINESLKDIFKKFIGKLSKDTEIKKDNEYNIQIKGSIKDNKILLDKNELIDASKKLSDLKSLGIDIVWLMPIYKRDGGLNSPFCLSF